MKYIKKYEQKSPPKYKLGDAIEIKEGSVHNYNVKYLVITDVDYIKNDVIQYEGVNLFNPGGDYFYILEEYIIRKLSDEEIELLKSSNKYNL